MRDDTLALLRIQAELERRASRRKLLSYYPDEGPLRRELYPKHTRFFALGAKRRQRLMLAANRIGKTESIGLYELTLHLTGRYPEWWAGRRFDRAISAWAAGDTSKTVRDILQLKLLGPVGSFGTGVMPGDAIVRYTAGRGIGDSVDTLIVKHVTGRESTLTLKSYDQRRESFQGTEQDVILLDEEPPEDIYTECLMRTMTNNGMLMLTFTPLMGMSNVVLAFLPGGKLDGAEDREDENRAVVTATWDDVPHLSEQAKRELLAAIPPFQRDARSKGVPQLGAGAIYPVPESEFVVADFPIPAHWPRAYGLDVGWNRTAAVWGAIDRDGGGTLYLYSAHYRGQAEPSVHADAIKSRGAWIPGVIDPASRGRGQKDGGQLMLDYSELGLDLSPAVNAVEAGLLAVWQRLSAGRIKVFRSLEPWLEEYRLYRRDDKGAVVKTNDHLMDATRYLVMSGIDRATVEVAPRPVEEEYGNEPTAGWMG